MTSPPPDDTGTDTLKRYRYQAKVAFPFCLDCATERNVVSIIVEHFEDLVIEYEDYWCFAQIKTRDPGRGPWKLTDVLGSSGGLKSLARTFQNISGIPAKFVLFLEGAVANGDPLENLVPPDYNPLNETLLKRTQEKLKITRGCREFLRSVTVQPNQRHRDAIDGYNVNLLGSLAPRIPHSELKATYEQIINRAWESMTADRVYEYLPDYIKDPTSMEISIRQKVEAKRISHDELVSLLGDVTDGPYLLLGRLTATKLPYPTDLELKLLAAGAIENVIEDAKKLRARASIRQSEIASATLFEDPVDKLEDVRERLRVLNNSVVQACQNSNSPGIQAWDELLKRLMDRAAEFVDPNKIFRQDPYVLLGVVCDIADKCLTDWGASIA